MITNGVLNLDGKLVSERLQKMKQKLPLEIFDKIDRITGIPKSEGVLDETEFVLAKLYQISAIDDAVIKLIKPLRQRFQDVDKDATGFITKSEVDNFVMPTAFVSDKNEGFSAVNKVMPIEEDTVTECLEDGM
ncbi:hypothetical protein CYMTET_12431 [Cymbomonas tetramitiformis]|uniref:EF-hand domain-containing protein n=1 Tax=Cymbomonas tetramitiformis TaxID=36881 RepID=A0AAE0GLN8_9CHLO|nr:hypothetical protein CYMTET_12431 [Cymbomonas tetramitiformis]